MSLNRSSRTAALLALLLVAATVPAAAVTVSADNAPNTAEVGSKVDVTFTFTELYTDYDKWTLKGQSGLTEVTWTVTTYDQTGKEIAQKTYNNKSFSHQISASDGVNKVTVRLQATVPQVSSWSYQPPQQFTLATFTQAQEGGTSTQLKSYDVRPYTQQSQQARMAITEAKDAIQAAQAAGADVSGAKSDLQDAIEFYNSGQFEQAIQNAKEAKQKAQAAKAAANRTDLLVKAGAGVVVLLVLAGAAYWFLQQRESHDKLG